MNPIKLLIITSFFPFNGKESWVESEANALTEIGIETYIAPRSYGSGLVSSTVKSNVINLNYISLEVFLEFLLSIPRIISRSYITKIWLHSDGLLDFTKRLSAIPKALTLSRHVRGENINHIHAHSTTNVATIAYLVAQELNIEWSYTLHTSSQLNKSFTRSYHNLTRSAAFVRTISDRTRGDLLNYLPYDANIHLCRLGVDLSNFPYLQGGIDYNSGGNPINIVMACVLEDYKGVIYALDAMRILRDSGIVFKMDIYGTGSKQGFLERFILDNGLSSCVVMHGYVEHDNLMNIFRQSGGAIFLLPSINNNGVVEGVPVAIMEAMASNMLVVTTNTGAISEIVIDRFNGYFVSEKSSESISEVIMHIIGLDRETRVLILHNARKMIDANYDSSKNAKLFSTLLREHAT